MPTPNEKQMQCINEIDGPFLVLAGPGTGKTFTVSHRIKNMIQNRGVDPEKILCLTFTDIAAGEMKSAIAKLMDEIECNVNIYTYHSFCNEIIKNNPQDFELPDNYRLISTAVSRSFIKECIDEINPVAFRTEKNDPYFYIQNISNRIDAVKRNRITKEQYFEYLETNDNWKPQLKIWKDKNHDLIQRGKKPVNLDKIKRLEISIAKAEELWEFYELYTKKMEKYHYIDFNDMICMVLDKFEKDKAFLSRIANEYEYILVDEYQDTNPVQNDLVFNLVRGLDNKNVFVVGDDDQIIFTFQGARLDTMERFLREFPETQVICLEENMRSTQTILDTARKIAIQDPNRLENNPDFAKHNICKKLTAKNPNIITKNEPVRFYKYADINQEYNEIVKEIADIIESEKCPIDKEGNKALSEIAIIARTNSELETFAEMLKDKNIPYELKEGKNIFNIKSVIVMYYYLQFLTNPDLHSDKIFRLLLTPPFSLNVKDYEKLYQIRSKYKSLIDSMKELKPEDCQDFTSIENFLHLFDTLREYANNETLHNVILEIGAKTGIFKYYMNSEINRCENIAGLKKLVDVAKEISEIKKTMTLEDFVDYLDTCIIDDIEINTEKAPVKMNAIQLSTYHSSKGKEFDIVYTPTLFNKKFESSNKSYKPEIPLHPAEAKTEDGYKEQKHADSIRLLYVGMTRARHTLRLSYHTPPAKTALTKFVLNIQDSLEKEPKPFEYSEDSYWKEMAESIIKKEYDYKKDFMALVDAKIEGKKFSASSINKYLKCPKMFFYEYILEFESKAGNCDAMSYGSAIHEACEFAVKTAIETGTYPSKEKFIEAYKNKSANLPFSTYEERQNYLTRGVKALDNFYHHLTDNKISTLKEAEYKLLFKIDDYEFVGYIDRLDKNEDGTYTIIDYKTGSAKGSSEIGLGKPHEDYYNQIGLYKYMFEKSTGNTVSETKFIFPDYPESPYSLHLTQDECEEIKNKFIQAIKDIKSYKFEACDNKEKSEEACKYCAYKDFCRMNIV